VVETATVIGWHRKGFRLFWTPKPSLGFTADSRRTWRHSILLGNELMSNVSSAPSAASDWNT
jgi:hypothetical protein